MSRATSRGMIQIEGITYRIVRLERHHYAVVRIRDDLQVGRFQTAPRLRVIAEQLDSSSLLDIARAALRTARTSAVMHAVPPMPEPAVPSEHVQRRPSSMPPPAAVMP